MPTYSSIPAWEIPWRGEPGRLPSMGSQRVEHNWVTELARTRTKIHVLYLVLCFLKCKIYENFSSTLSSYNYSVEGIIICLIEFYVIWIWLLATFTLVESSNGFFFFRYFPLVDRGLHTSQVVLLLVIVPHLENTMSGCLFSTFLLQLISGVPGFDAFFINLLPSVFSTGWWLLLSIYHFITGYKK